MKPIITNQNPDARVKFWTLFAFGILTFIAAVLSCDAQVNGNFTRVRLVPSTVETGTAARNGTMLYNSTSNQFRFYQNGAWVNPLSQPTSQITILSQLGSTIDAECIPYYTATSNQALTSQRAQYVAIYLPAGVTVNGLKFFVTTSGNYTASDSNVVALYSYSGGTLTRVAKSISDPNIWNTGTGMKSKAFQTPYVTTYSGVYFASYLWVVSAVVVSPVLAAGPLLTVGVAIDLTNSAKTNGYTSATLDLPATQAISGLTASQSFHWIATY